MKRPKPFVLLDPRLPWAVSCPYCRVEPGEPCTAWRRAGGATYDLAGCHVQRGRRFQRLLHRALGALSSAP